MINLFFSTLDETITYLLEYIGITGEPLYYAKAIVAVLIIFIFAFIANWIAKNIILVFVWKFIGKSKNKWLKFLVKNKFFKRLSHIAPVIFIYLLGPIILDKYEKLAELTYLVTNIYVIVAVWLIIYSFINVLSDIYNTLEVAKARPIKGYIQVFKIIVGIIAAILIISLLLGQSPLVMLTGLGAMTAVLMLVFRDTILGFVGGLQVTANDLVRIGDWIEMPKYGADGDVVDITLHAVSVQNWDRTISVIPTYSLASEGFKNWRGMVSTGGRRIMRSVYIDMKSIKFCNNTQLEKFENVAYLKDYIKSRKKEIQEYNKNHNYDDSNLVNGRRMTNIGVFRAYITNYLANHPSVKTDLLYMVRQLQPNEKGLPLEVYCFANTTEWAIYERIQADIFDHIFSVIPFFDLDIYQLPSDINVKLGDKKMNMLNDQNDD